MTAERDDEKFAQLVDALGPYLDRVVIVGGWAHRLFRNHPLAQTLPYAPLMTRDTDVALPTGIRFDQETLRERLLSRGFHEEFLGDDRPPITHYRLGDHDAGFYVEFLTPLVGGEFRRDDTRDVTTTIAGITAQKLRYLGVLLIAPWSVPFTLGGQTGQLPARINIANPVSYIVQKLLVSGKRKPRERAKDVRLHQGVLRDGLHGRPQEVRRANSYHAGRRRSDRADRHHGACVIQDCQGRHAESLPGLPHGMCSTHKDQINADLLAFFKGEKSSLRTNVV